LAVGRKVRCELGCGIRGELYRVAAVSIADPDISAVNERQMILRHGGLA
jgi:hypothetical protein